MASEIKVDTISENTSNNGVGLNHPLNIKSYTTTEMNALTGMSTGAVIYNTTEDALYFYEAGVTSWFKVKDGTFSATGGTIVTSGGYKYHTFTSSSTLVVTGEKSGAEYLVIAGGGGGCAGGGGAGGVLSAT